MKIRATVSLYLAMRFADSNVGGGKDFAARILYALGFLEGPAQDAVFPLEDLSDLKAQPA